VLATAPGDGTCDFVSRFFAPRGGIDEDPVTGSAIGCIASYLVGEGVLLAAPEAVVQIEQGHEVGRPGKVTARISASNGIVRRVQVGGRCVHVGNGEVWLPGS
jgi:PhzF family phenazine biosynthesis protein